MSNSLAERLKVLRLKRRESLQELADSVSASKAHVWELETGRSRNPSMELITRLAKHFEVPVSSLLGEDPATEEDAELLTMFRDLKQVTANDRALLKSMLETMKRLKRSGADDE
jgi:transcriptional regulator with XRE-family HTH domain